MTKRATAITKVIEHLDAKIEALRAVREDLLEQQRAQTRTPKAVKAPAAPTAKVG